ncbi:MAG TPA: DUF4149 domain-containing protein [Isosphaeraceae bacterium]|nr:DUF4149 domain-containing protein [Isosphaeraceae bacterium]
MTARLLLDGFDTVYLLALTAWMGSVLFLSFGVAPIVFKVLDAEHGARFVRGLFPRYYAWGATCGAIALAASVLGPLSVPELRGPRVAVQAAMILAGTLIMLYCGNSLTPAINAAQDAGPAGQERFQRLHQLSVRLNSIVLILGVVLVAAFATRPAPTTSGIIELSPIERFQIEQEKAQKAREEAQKGSQAPSAPPEARVASPPPP